jgi:hypothetical protein
MIFLSQILRDLHAILIAHFWPTWVTLTAAAAICVAWAVGQAAAPGGQSQYERHLVPTWRQVGTPGGIAALGMLAAFLVCYIAMILVWEDFAYYDHSFFTRGTLKGYNIALEIWPENGRFCPLNFQEFNLIRHFTDTVSGYHVLPIAELLIFVSILLILNDELSIAARGALAILALLTPSILISFGGLIYPERNELLFLACLVLCVKRFEQTQSTAWAVAAAVCAQFMLYYKETAFLLLLGFAAGKLILRCRNGPHARWDYNRIWDKEGRLDLTFAGLGLLFLLYYFGAMGLHPNMGYAGAARQPFLEVLLAYLRLDLLAWLLVAVVLGRIYLILRDRTAPLPLWDGLAFGGVVCFLAYLYLRILTSYYLAPVDLIAVLYVGRFTILSLKEMCSWRRVAVFIVGFTIVSQDVFFSTSSRFERKNGIQAKAAITRVVEGQYRSRSETPLRLFFPFAGPYMITEFAYFLSYHGIPVEGVEGKGAGPNDVVLSGRAIAEDGPCVVYRSIRCHAASGPAPGDLVIVLPDDTAPSAQASAYRARGEQLFSYEPRPAIPQWLHLLVADLDKVPDRWEDASVTIWK